MVGEATLAKTQAIPGEEVGLKLKMFNAGESATLFAGEVDVELREKGTTESKGAGTAEPYPPTTMWRTSAPITVGIPILVPRDLKPAEYGVFVVVRTKMGRRVIPSSLGNETTPLESVEVGTLSVGNSESPATANTKTFGKIPAKPTETKEEPKGSILALSNDFITTRLSATAPCFVGIGSEKSDALQGSRDARIPEWLFYRKSDGQWYSTLSSPDATVSYAPRMEGDRVIYAAEIKCRGETAFTCDVVFSLAESELRVGYENVEENGDYLFTDLTWPRLLEAGPEARLVNGRFAGRLLAPDQCTPGMVTHEDTWYDSFPGALIYTPDVLAAVLPVSLGDSVLSSIAGGKTNSAGVGLHLVHRIGSLDGKWDRWILAGTSSMMRIRILERHDPSAPPLSWMDGAKMLRKDFSDVRPPALYKDTVLYKILLDIKKYPGIPDDKPVTTYPEAKAIIQQIRRLTDNEKQIVYLTGAQHEGQDTKYPDMFTVNTQVGTYEELIKFMNEGKSENATISFHSVLNEIYKDSPMWNEDLVCRDPLGELAVYTTHFVGGTNYSINYPWFVAHGLQGFLDRLLSMYPIPNTYHIDVLSTRGHNIDFSPMHPCPPIEGYFGRLNMIQSFNLRGVDITSEGLTSWFIGKIGHAWLLRIDPFTTILGEEQIPLAAFLYHGHATYGYPSELNPLMGLLNGATFSLDLVPLDRMPFAWPGNSIEDCLYLINFPFQLLRDREIQGYDRKGNLRRVTYDEKTFVEVEVADNQIRPSQGYAQDSIGAFRVVIDGREIAKDFTAFVPSPAGKAYLAYSKKGGTVSYPLPPGWLATKKVICEPLPRDPSGTPSAASATLKGQTINLNLPAGVPVRIFQP